jgi:hypothetical protein
MRRRTFKIRSMFLLVFGAAAVFAASSAESTETQRRWQRALELEAR